MLHDHVIMKTAGISDYASHQLLEQMTGGARPLFINNGDHLIFRSEDPDLTPRATVVRPVKEGDIVGFELRASCGVKTKGKQKYFALKDWRARRDWLERKAQGFEVVAVTISSETSKIQKGSKTIKIDQTDFTGILKVTDVSAFLATLKNGVSTPGKAFGRGLLII